MLDIRAAHRPGSIVIRAADLGVWADARAVLADAQARAAAVVADADRHLEAKRIEGHAAGVAAGQAQIAALLVELTARRDAALSEIAETLPALVGAVLDRILGAADRGTMLRDAVRHGMQDVYRGGGARLRVAPEGQDAAREALASAARYAAITIDADPSLPPGACRFECDYGSAELGLVAQLQAVRDGLAKGWTA